MSSFCCFYYLLGFLRFLFLIIAVSVGHITSQDFKMSDDKFEDKVEHKVGFRFSEIKIPVPWGHISGKWYGPEDKQPLLAIHGWQENAGSFDLLVPLLPREMPVLCIDLPGHGQSSHFPEGQFYYIWWDYIVILRRIVKYYNWTTVSILGHSLGGAIGFMYAAVYPDEVDKLIQLDIVCPRVESLDKTVEETSYCIDRFLKYEKLTDMDVPCYNYEIMVDIVFHAYKGSVTRKNCEILMRRGMNHTDTKANVYQFTRDPRLKVAGLATLSTELVKKYAEKITCEYLNIQANNGIVFTKPNLYKELLEIIKQKAKRFEYHLVPGTHHVHLEDPTTVSKIICAFLRKFRCCNISNNVEDLVV